MSLALLADTPCADCGAPLGEGQRYCVHCGRRRPDVEDPAITWLAETRSERTRVTATAAPAAPVRNPLALPAIALAILPLAVAVGVLVGHHGNGGTDQKALLEALRSQPAPVVKVNGGGVAAASTRAVKAKKAASKAKSAKKDATGAKVVAKTKYGVAHQASGFKPPAAKIQSDNKLVQKINNSIGKDYLKAQRDLPDTIVVSPNSGSTTSPGAQGRGD